MTLFEAEDYLEGGSKLVLTNEDGQMTECEFPVNPMEITESVGTVVEGKTATQIKVCGKNFGMGTRAQWREVGGDPRELPEDAVARASETELSVTIAPGRPGMAKLTLRSAIDLTASLNVTVKEIIEKVGPLVASKVNVPVTLRRVPDDIDVAWKPAGGVRAPILKKNVAKSNTGIVVELDPGPPGEGELTLIYDGYEATKKVRVT